MGNNHQVKRKQPLPNDDDVVVTPHPADHCEDQYTMVSRELYKTMYAPEKHTVHGTRLCYY